MKRIESEYRKAFAGVTPAPALRARTEAMVHTLGRSRTRRVRKALLCLALCVILLCATAVAAREFGLLSFWQSGYAGNQELLAALEPLLETVNAEYEGAVALTVSEALLYGKFPCPPVFRAEPDGCAAVHWRPARFARRCAAGCRRYGFRAL